MTRKEEIEIVKEARLLADENQSPDFDSEKGMYLISRVEFERIRKLAKAYRELRIATAFEPTTMNGTER